MSAPDPTALRRYRRFLLFVVVFTLGVILWGALVRITGSGAGCGQHWPTCHGEIVPLDPTAETFIEFFHRATSGICVLLIVALYVRARRTFAPGHPARSGAGWTFAFIIVESLIGAAIVLLKYVGDNDSVGRAVWMAVHLANTFVLMYWMAMTVWWTWHPERVSLRAIARRSWTVPAITVAVLLVSMTGAVSALGHTLFPADAATGPLEHLRNDPWIHTNYPMLVRVVHPAFALATTLALWAFANAAASETATARTRRLALLLAVATAAQVLGGFVNIALHAPGWMQLVHLGMANAVWILWVLLVASWMQDHLDEGAGGAFARALRSQPIP